MQGGGIIHAYWQLYLADQPVPGSFGENLTTVGLWEDQVRVSDCFLVGTAVLMALQPRPCFKLGLRDKFVVRRFVEPRRSGIYFRVFWEGLLQAGDVMALLESAPYEVTIRDMDQADALGPHDQKKLARVGLALPPAELARAREFGCWPTPRTDSLGRLFDSGFPNKPL